MTRFGQSDTLAIIGEPRFGVGDRGGVVLTFSVYVTESSAALQVFGAEEGAKIIEAYGGDVETLRGKPCWVDTSDPGLIRWVRPWKGRIR